MVQDDSQINDPDAAILKERYPTLKLVGERIKILSGPLKGEPKIIRRKLTERGGVPFTLEFENGQIRGQKWID
jgi:hypothetical protein